MPQEFFHRDFRFYVSEGRASHPILEALECMFAESIRHRHSIDS